MSEAGSGAAGSDRARRLAVVVRRALLMIVAALDAEFGLGAERPERKAS